MTNAESDRNPERVTRRAEANEQLLYFTSTSLTMDDRRLVFISDRTPGPKTSNYPADCLVDDCLIYLTGRVEKQTSPVQIELAHSITVRHCSRTIRITSLPICLRCRY